MAVSAINSKVFLVYGVLGPYVIVATWGLYQHTKSAGKRFKMLQKKRMNGSEKKDEHHSSDSVVSISEDLD